MIFAPFGADFEVVQGHAPLFPFSFIARIVKLLNIIHLTIASFYSFVIFYGVLHS
jgi:hypothetical protein